MYCNVFNYCYFAHFYLQNLILDKKKLSHRPFNKKNKTKSLQKGGVDDDKSVKMRIERKKYFNRNLSLKSFNLILFHPEK